MIDLGSPHGPVSVTYTPLTREYDSPEEAHSRYPAHNVSTKFNVNQKILNYWDRSEEKPFTESVWESEKEEQSRVLSARDREIVSSSDQSLCKPINIIRNEVNRRILTICKK